MATAHVRSAEPLDSYQHEPSTQETEVHDDDAAMGQYEDEDHETDAQMDGDNQEQQPSSDPEAEDQAPEEEDELAEGDASDEDIVDESVQHDMIKLQNTFPGFKDKYRLIKRIGEGTFSTVYKAEDLQYDYYDNMWDLDRDLDRWLPTPVKAGQTGAGQRSQTKRKPKYVAIKKIYVTSSPSRILNELDLLHCLRGCPGICPMVTAFRHTDQVVAILPYFRHADFRDYFRDMLVSDMAIYLRSLFTALKWVHREKILHRDIKPTNFLYDPTTQRGVLVDFGLAERQGCEGLKPCICQDSPEIRRAKLKRAYANSETTEGQPIGYPKEDRRPSRRANRAGTRGFRAPEVLFKCTQQTTKIDVWSVGVILLTILSRRFPFFNSADDVEAMIEIATIFGTRRMKAAAQTHGCAFETSIPTIGTTGFSLERIILWSTCRADKNEQLSEDEKLAVEFLYLCLELDPRKRISASDALEHRFLTKWSVDAVASGDDDEVDMVEPCQ